MNLEKRVKDILHAHPHTRGSNTEICIQIWKDVAAARGIFVDPEIWDIIRKYKPESVPRARRSLAKEDKLAKTTDQQKEWEYKFWKEYKR